MHKPSTVYMGYAMGNAWGEADVEAWADRLELSFQCTKVCILRFIDHLDQQAIALLLGVHQSTVSRELGRARSKHPDLPRLLSHGRHYTHRLRPDDVLRVA